MRNTGNKGREFQDPTELSDFDFESFTNMSSLGVGSTSSGSSTSSSSSEKISRDNVTSLHSNELARY